MRSARAVLYTSVLLLLATTPAFAYWDDVHYHLTYYVARVVGYTPEQAYRVAAADLATDYCDTTEPTQMSVMDYLAGAREDEFAKQAPRWKFHAFRDETVFPGAIGPTPASRATLADEAREAQRDALAEAAGKEDNLNPGVYLHFVQDEAPHSGFGSAFGHYFDPADPAGSTQKAREAGLLIGGTVDWIGFPAAVLDRALPTEAPPADDVAARTADALSDILTSVSPRQRAREYRPADFAALSQALRRTNPFPAPLALEDLAPYVAFVKARKGGGAMPPLTPAQEAKFPRHADGPNLAAAEQAVKTAMATAGMLDEGIPDYREARRAFQFDSEGNFVAERREQYVLTSSLRVQLEAERDPIPQVELVIQAPPTFLLDAPYDLTKPQAMAVPSSVTYDQIPVGRVVVEVRLPNGKVLASEDVQVEGHRNIVTIGVRSEPEAPGEKQILWVLAAGSPEVRPGGSMNRGDYGSEYTLTESDASAHIWSTEAGIDLWHRWTITPPPKVLRFGDTFTVKAVHSRSGRGTVPGDDGAYFWVTAQNSGGNTWGHLVSSRTGKYGETEGFRVDSETEPRGPEGVFEFSLPAPPDSASMVEWLRDTEGVSESVGLEWRSCDGIVTYWWKSRLVTAQQAEELAKGAGAPPTAPATGTTAPAPGTNGGGGATAAPGAGATGSEGGGPRLGLSGRSQTGGNGQPEWVIGKVGPESPLAVVAQPGDILVSVDGSPIGTTQDVAAALAGKQPGDTVQVVLRRGDQVIAAIVRLLAPRAP